MATAWDRVAEEYRAYLELAGYSAADFNGASFNRAGTYNEFVTFNQQQQQDGKLLVVFVFLYSNVAANTEMLLYSFLN
jgi:hypothetical protein